MGILIKNLGFVAILEGNKLSYEEYASVLHDHSPCIIVVADITRALIWLILRDSTVMPTDRLRTRLLHIMLLFHH